MSEVSASSSCPVCGSDEVADWRSFKRGPYVVYDPDDETYLAVGGAWHLDLDDGDSFAIFEDAQRAADDAGLGKVESYWVHQCPDLIHDAYQQFTLQRLGQEFDAGEACATCGKGRGYFEHHPFDGVNYHEFDHPPQSRGQAFDGEAEAVSYPRPAIWEVHEKDCEAMRRPRADCTCGPTRMEICPDCSGAGDDNNVSTCARCNGSGGVALSSAKRGEEG